MSARGTNSDDPDRTFMLCSNSATGCSDLAFLSSAKSLLFLCSEDRRANIFPSNRERVYQVPFLPESPPEPNCGFCQPPRDFGSKALPRPSATGAGHSKKGFISTGEKTVSRHAGSRRLPEPCDSCLCVHTMYDACRRGLQCRDQDPSSDGPQVFGPVLHAPRLLESRSSWA